MSRITKIILGVYCSWLYLLLFYFDCVFQMCSSFVVSLFRISFQFLPQFFFNFKYFLQMVVSHCIGSLLGKMLAKFNIIYFVRQSLDHIFGNISQTEISSLWSAFTFRGPMLDDIFSRSGIGGVGIHSKWLLIIIADISCIYGRSAIVLDLICIASVGINWHESVGIVTQECRVVGRKQTVGLQTFLIFLYVVNSCIFPTFSTHISRRVRSPLLFVVRTGLLEGRARRESLINFISLG